MVNTRKKDTPRSSTAAVQPVELGKMEEAGIVPEPVPLRIVKPISPKTMKKESAKSAMGDSIKGQEMYEEHLTSFESDPKLHTLKRKRKTEKKIGGTKEVTTTEKPKERTPKKIKDPDTLSPLVDPPTSDEPIA
ncbi:hypothetical protein Dimus_010395 [Dionaea muscipula]